MSRDYRDKDLEILKKIYEERSNCHWGQANLVSEEYDSIQFPNDAEKLGSVFFCEYRDNFFVFTGSYSARFYYEEDRYNYEKRTFVAFVSTRVGRADCIAFITDENLYGEYNKLSIKTPLRNILFKANNSSETNRVNFIEEIFDYAKYTVNNIDEFYEDLLNEDDDSK
ncbi:hypothetical protein [Bacillus zhangzhouensis]|uniref:hypothetical protein n=1 Tax=Bacillus zhangzhouensis TaxID=1178540 RepID=UPI003D23A724